MKKRIRIAVVVDNITAHSLAPDAGLIHLTPCNWRWQLRFNKPDFLFVESAWRGYKGKWQGKIASCASDRKQSQSLNKIVEWCNKNRIPTVFWNKEDPIHFNRFQKTSLPFKYVYTTDANTLEDYQQLKHREAEFTGVLPFAAQPVHFKPAPYDKRESSVAFAGGYYGDELPERSRVTLELLSGLVASNLIIYDRFWHRKKASSFPEPFERYTVPGVRPEKVADIYSQHALYLNINTVSDSPTMLSRRVFELAASGACIISSPSQAMSNFFNDLIPVVSTAGQAAKTVDNLLGSPAKRIDLGKLLHETVMQKHTWQHRLNQVKSDLGI